MRRAPRVAWLAFGAAWLLAACAAPAPRPMPAETALPPSPAPPAVPADANLIVVAYEVVERPEKEGLGALRVFVDGAPAGTAGPALRSAEKRWGARLAPGNRLLRLERWVLPGAWDWVRPEQGQPRERFVRVEEGSVTTVVLKFFDDGTKHSYAVQRAPTGARTAP